jgi:hypothetical protein
MFANQAFQAFYISDPKVFEDFIGLPRMCREYKSSDWYNIFFPRAKNSSPVFPKVQETPPGLFF